MVSNQQLYDSMPYNKLLIIVSGNIDQAYSFSKWVQQADIDADVIKDMSKQINIINIKSALQSKFKPQQVSRFGNSHIIYPTIGRNQYVTLINKKLLQVQNSIKRLFGIQLNMDDSITKCIYDNGVFPAQGVRPLFSTISTILQSNIPKFLLTALQTNNKQISLSIVDGCLISSVDPSQKISLQLALDQIRRKKKLSNDRKILLAVHQAGHAILIALNYQRCPDQITIRTTSSNGGFVYDIADINNSRKNLLLKVQSILGGRVAQELVFGGDNVTNGASRDIVMATQLSANIIRR